MDMFLLVLVGLLIVFDLLALRWGYDSTDKIDSPEWERRQTWRQFEMTTTDTSSIPYARRASLNGHAPLNG
jgi:hypothetical protein